MNNEIKGIAHQANVLAVEALADQNVLLTLFAPDIARAAVPGQFVNVESGHLLKRPLGIASVDLDAGTISIGVHVVGKGSKALSDAAKGDTLTLLGPLGNGFRLENLSEAVLVGGGTGVYPLLFTAEALKRRGVHVTTILGFRSPEQILLANRFEQASDRLIIASEAGGADIKGTAIDALNAAELLTESGHFALLACGPMGLLKAVAAFTKTNRIETQVSLETRMGCGFGVCRCCPVPVTDGINPGVFDYERCCVEGPVFAADRLVWEEL